MIIQFHLLVLCVSKEFSLIKKFLLLKSSYTILLNDSNDPDVISLVICTTIALRCIRESCD